MKYDKTVAIVNWDESLHNFGDMILIDCASYLVNGGGDTSRRMDFGKLNWSIPFKIFNKIFCPLLRFSESFGYNNCLRGRIHYFLKSFWYSIYLDKYYEVQLRGCHAVITAGGAPLKCQTQDEGFYLERLLKVAKDKNLPVMINAGAIEEKINEDDIRFIRLFRRLKSSTVRCITTRNNDIEIVKHYLPSTDITFGAVADTAFWIPETYEIIKDSSSDIIGINLVRENICSDYNTTNLSNEGLFRLYKRIIEELDNRDYRWVLFSNGISQDLEFGKKLCKQIGVDWQKAILPTAKSTREYVEQVSGFKAVISGRMHSAITAYALDIPVVAFVWSKKMRNFADGAGIGEMFLDEKSISGEALVNSLEKAIRYPRSIGEEQKRKKALIKSHIDAFLSENI